MNFLARVSSESRVVDLEAEGVKVLCDELGRRLLAVETECEGLDSAEEKKGVERGETVSDRVDGEGDSLECRGQFRLARIGEAQRRTLATSARLQVMTPAIKSWWPLRYLVPLS